MVNGGHKASNDLNGGAGKFGSRGKNGNNGNHDGVAGNFVFYCT